MRRSYKRKMCLKDIHNDFMRSVRFISKVKFTNKLSQGINFYIKPQEPEQTPESLKEIEDQIQKSLKTIKEYMSESIDNDKENGWKNLQKEVEDLKKNDESKIDLIKYY